jgi:dTDP-4-dehydrorhamnose reductase
MIRPAPKLWLTGANGLFGSNFRLTVGAKFPQLQVVTRQPAIAGGSQVVTVDLADRAATRAALDRTEPDCILHAAALADVDRCEREPALARTHNVAATETLAQWARDHEALLVFISTDSVYDESAESKNEQTAVAPLNVYAQTKWEAEEIVRRLCPETHLILRTNFFGWSPQPGQQLVEWALARLKSGKTVPGFVDVFFSSLLVNDLAELIVALQAVGARGTFNAGAADGCSKFEFLQNLAQILGYTPDQVKPSSVREVALTARRSSNLVMDSSKLARAIGRPVPSWKEGLKRLVELQRQDWSAQLSGMTARSNVSL